MTYEKEMKLTIDELTQISWKCSSCGNEQCLDVSSHEKVNKLPSAMRFLKCGLCGVRYDSALGKAIHHFIELYNKIVESRCSVVFRVSVQDEEKKL